jgi:hypothetical protein
MRASVRPGQICNSHRCILRVDYALCVLPPGLYTYSPVSEGGRWRREERKTSIVRIHMMYASASKLLPDDVSYWKRMKLVNQLKNGFSTTWRGDWPTRKSVAQPVYGRRVLGYDVCFMTSVLL